MNARKRQKLLRIIYLANKHPACAKEVDVRVSTRQGEKVMRPQLAAHDITF